MGWSLVTVVGHGKCAWECLSEGLGCDFSATIFILMHVVHLACGIYRIVAPWPSSSLSLDVEIVDDPRLS